MKRGITLCLLSSLALVAQAHEAAEGVIKERMDRFKENKESKKSIKARYLDAYLESNQCTPKLNQKRQTHVSEIV